MIKGQTRFLVLLFDCSLILFFQFSDVSLKYSNLFPVGNFIFKLTIETLEQSVKNVQS